MGKKRSQKTKQKANKKRKIELERKVNAAVDDAFAADVANGTIAPPGKLTIAPEHRHLLEDFPGPKPPPPKKKTLYSGKTPPIPPPPLLDLIHNFLKDFKYIKAAHGMRTDNQKRPGHNMSIWKWTSDGMPDLLRLFLQWQDQNPGRSTVISGEDPTPKRTEGMALGVYGSHPEYISRAAYMGADVTKDGSSESEKEEQGALEKGFKVHSKDSTLSKFSNGVKRKASDLSSSASDSAESGHDSDSDASASSSDENEDEDEKDTEKSKKRRFGAAPQSKRGKTITKKEGVSQSSSPRSSSPNDSEDTVKAPIATLSSNDQVDYGLLNGSESSVTLSSPTMNLDSTAERDPSHRLKGIEARSRTSDSTSSASKSSASSDSGSESSSGLESDSNSRSDSSSSNSASSSSNSEAESKSESESSGSSESSASRSEIDKEEKSKPAVAKRKPKKDFLVYNEPLSKKARARGEKLGEEKTVEATAQNFKMLKKKHVPFSRIPADLRVEDKFNSNAYVPYDYANKAYQDLSITKGKAFTKAKNKGKRGSYRGGQIDMSARGIKFDD